MTAGDKRALKDVEGGHVRMLEENYGQEESMVRNVYD